jgi:XrtJ-associated TM-motif-TM protein
MTRSTMVFLGCGLILLVAAPLRAQTGCTDSPENPTAVLALVGGVGALWSAVRARRR